jgi:hypothetical protein
MTHGGQVGAPVGTATVFDPDSACIHGNWEHVRHEQGNNEGNFHAKSFDSLLCACLACLEDPGSGVVIGGLCNPGARTCGPEPRRAPANKICFSGVGDYPHEGPATALSASASISKTAASPATAVVGTPPPTGTHPHLILTGKLAKLNNATTGCRLPPSLSAQATAVEDGAVGPDGPGRSGRRSSVSVRPTSTAAAR